MDGDDCDSDEFHDAIDEMSSEDSDHGADEEVK